MGFRWRTISCKQTNVSSLVYLVLRVTCHVSHITRNKVKMLRRTIVLIVPSDRLDFDRSLRSIPQIRIQRFRSTVRLMMARARPSWHDVSKLETDRAREHVERFLLLSWRELVRRELHAFAYTCAKRYRIIRSEIDIERFARELWTRR